MDGLSGISKRAETLRFIRYCLVGALNTLVTLCTIFICKSLFGVNEYVSNAIGYVAGVVNSFLWNRQWVFRSEGRLLAEGLKFFIGFAICYALQLAAVVALNTTSLGQLQFRLSGFVISGYGVATILGCVVYTLSNFIFNRLVTFRRAQT